MVSYSYNADVYSPYTNMDLYEQHVAIIDAALASHTVDVPFSPSITIFKTDAELPIAKITAPDSEPDGLLPNISRMTYAHSILGGSLSTYAFYSECEFPTGHFPAVVLMTFNNIGLIIEPFAICQLPDGSSDIEQPDFVPDASRPVADEIVRIPALIGSLTGSVFPLDMLLAFYEQNGFILEKGPAFDDSLQEFSVM